MASPGDADVEASVEHDASGERFVARVDGEEVGFLEYAARGEALDLLHTVVLPESRGRGVGEALVRAALAHARSLGGRVIPSCPFVAAYFDGHPDERDVAVAGT